METIEKFKDLIYLLCINVETRKKTVDVLTKYIGYLPVDKYLMLCDELRKLKKWP